jgi:hypothetical protein
VDGMPPPIVTTLRKPAFPSASVDR